MEDRTSKRQQAWLIWVPALLAVAVFVAAIVRRWRRQRLAERLARPVPLAAPPIPFTLEGLTEAEAEARRLEGQDNSIPFRPQRSFRQVLRENIYTVFNLSLVGLSFAQLLLGLPLDALLSLGMIGVNAALNFGQEAFARIRIRNIEAAMRLRATLIRESKVRSIDPNEVVLGDILVVASGDQLLVDGAVVEGQITVDESLLTGENQKLVKRTGDRVYAGSFCLSGRGAYRAETVGEERAIVARLAESQAAKEELTTLERIVARVLRVLLVVVAAMSALLLFRYFNIETPVDANVIADAASVVFSIAPASLFFMIFLTYAAGTADLAQVGALVHRARAVEALAHATTICFAKSGILTGTFVELDTVEPPVGQGGLARSRIRQILGDFVRSISMDSLATRALASAFEGGRRSTLEEAPYLVAYGWSGLAFDDDDLRGVYVLGEPEILEVHLLADSEATTEQEPTPSPVAALRQRLPSVGRWFRRSKQAPGDQSSATAGAGELAAVMGEKEPELVQSPTGAGNTRPPSAEAEGEDSSALSEKDEPSVNLFRRTLARVRGILPKREPEPDESEAPEEEMLEESVLLFAYRPEIAPLHDLDGNPQVPDGLIPLCELRYSEQVRPEAIETIQAFAETGVHIKIFSAGPPTQTIALLQRAGLQGDGGRALDATSGPELAQMDPEQMGNAVREAMVFGYLTPEQAAMVVQTLRSQGEAVALVGDGVNDVPAMRQASLSIAQHSSSQAALSVADIILLQDSPKVLLNVLRKGQRIANGLLDVLKLYLTQMIYLALLILLLWIFAKGFPYASKQGTIISVVTVSIPAAGLSLWAASGLLPTRNIQRILARFVVPAALTISAAGLLLYLLFLEQTGDMAYAQLAVTYALVGMGLLLVLFLKPPARLWVGGTSLSGDWRFTVAVVVLLVAFFFLAWIPLARELFLLERLRQPSDYLIIGAAVLGWAITVRLIWWLIPLIPKERIPGPKRLTV